MIVRKLVLAMWFGVACGAAAVGAETPAPAPRQVRQASMYADVRAHNVGDILTVAIIERASASNSDRRSARRTTTFDNKSAAGTGALSSIPEFGMSASLGRDHEGTGQQSREGRLTARLAVTVTEVKPNGDLVVSGQHEVTVNSEKETLQLTGTVRPTDIGAGNVVYSTDIADAKISYKGKGELTKGTRPGMIAWLFSWLF
jgi:flagellar L-ring protein precursor FlgH